VYGFESKPGNRVKWQASNAGEKNAEAVMVERGTPSGPYAFTADYVSQLKDGIPSVAQHFAAYFSNLLVVKLRKRLRSSQLIEDICQETLLRVLTAIQRDGVRDRARLGAFVNGVCNNVLLEFVRADSRYLSVSERDSERPNDQMTPEILLGNDEGKRQVGRVLAQLSQKDRELLRMILFEELDRSIVCRKLGVSRDYLRTLLYRARKNFRERFSMFAGVGGQSKHAHTMAEGL
jgi:RNA polymerase sigma-70 factor (ECF subfamily)